MKSADLLVRKFRRYPFWSQVLLTLGSIVVLVALWSACGLPPPASRRPLLATPQLEWNAQGGPVLALAYNSKGAWLASGTADGVVRLWDSSNGELIHSLKGHNAGVTSLAVNSDGSLLATGSLDMTVKLWNPAKEEELHTFVGHTAPVTGVVFSPDGRWLASASRDKTIKIWSVSTAALIRTLEGHTLAINSIALSPNGQILASASNDATIRLWEPSTGNLLHTLSGQNSSVLSVAFSPDGKLLASTGIQLFPGDHKALLKLWDPVSGKEAFSFFGLLGDARSIVFRPDNKVLASASGSYDVFGINSWLLSGRTPLRSWNASHAVISALAYSPDGSWLASGAADGRISLWNVGTGAQEARFASPVFHFSSRLPVSVPSPQ
jgi:WD40 repeat protein